MLDGKYRITVLKRYIRYISGVIIVALLVACGDKAPTTPVADDRPETIESLRLQLRNNLHDADLRLRLARLHLQAEEGQAAESHLRRAIALGAQDPLVQIDLVRSLILQKNFSDAKTLLEKSFAEAGDFPTAQQLMLRGEIQIGAREIDKRAILMSFINAYRAQAVRADATVAERLQVLANRYPAVQAAREHFECADTGVQMIEPQVQEVAGRVLQVGPGRTLKVPSAAAKVAQDGDLVEIDAGVYRGDVAIWTQNNLTLRGVGGIAELKAAGRHAKHLGIWVFEGNNITAENIGFYDAKVRHRNGAGIRLHGKSATIRNCHFYNNENGILGSDIADSDVLIEFSTFTNNGYGDGQSHNIYIGRARTFTLRYSYSTGANVGHLVKSRAFDNAILFNRLIDGEDGQSSYVINLPEGGRAWIVGNELQQGPDAQNPIMISFGEESDERADQALYLVNNTIYNRMLDGIVLRNSTEASAVLANNIFAGARSSKLIGPGARQNNLLEPGPWFRNASELDFHLTPEAPAIDAGVDPMTIEGLQYMPVAEYRHPARGQQRLRTGAIDIGAREFCGF